MSGESTAAVLSPEQLIENVKNDPESLAFADIMATIDTYFSYTPTRFTNGLSDQAVNNAAGTNEGSCKVIAFAQLNNFTQAQTLACFGHYYREHVLANPEGDDHPNIRQFMRDGWAGIHFSGTPLVRQ